MRCKSSQLLVVSLALSCGGANKSNSGLNTPRSNAPAPTVPTLGPTQVALTQSPPTQGHNPSAASPLLEVMAQENIRWMSTLHPSPGERAQDRAHYLAYTVHDVEHWVMSADGGSLLTEDHDTHRLLHVDVRVGSPQRDHTHPLENKQLAGLLAHRRLGKIATTDNLKAFRHGLWLETDRRYRESALIWRLVQTENQVRQKKSGGL